VAEDEEQDEEEHQTLEAKANLQDFVQVL